MCDVCIWDTGCACCGRGKALIALTKGTIWLPSQTYNRHVCHSLSLIRMCANVCLLLFCNGNICAPIPLQCLQLLVINSCTNCCWLVYDKKKSSSGMCIVDGYSMKIQICFPLACLILHLQRPMWPGCYSKRIVTHPPINFKSFLPTPYNFLFFLHEDFFDKSSCRTTSMHTDIMTVEPQIKGLYDLIYQVFWSYMFASWDEQTKFVIIHW